MITDEDLDCFEEAIPRFGTDLVALLSFDRRAVLILNQYRSLDVSPGLLGVIVLVGFVMPVTTFLNEKDTVHEIKQ